MKFLNSNPLFLALNIRPGEGEIVWLLFSLSFLLGLTVVFFETTATALFLSKFEVTKLPYVYMGSALLVLVSGYVYSKLEAFLTFTQLLTATLATLSFNIILLRFSLEFLHSQWPVLILLLWVEIIAVFTGLVFWSLAGRLLNLRQGKRLFGLVSAGEVMAGIIGGITIPSLVPLIGTANLLWVSVNALVGGLMMMLYIDLRFAKQLASSFIETEENEKSTAHSQPMPRKYLRLLAGLAGLSLFGYYFIDYLFYDSVESRYTDEDTIASFLGSFFAVVGVVNLLFRAFISGHLVSRYGLSLGLLFLPIILTIGSGVAILVDLLSGEMIILFWVVVATKLFDSVSRASVDDPSVIILYQPLPVEQRLRAQTFTDSVVEPIACILVGTILLLITSYWSLPPLYLLVLLLVILVIWFVVANQLHRQYILTLTNALTKRTLGGEALILNDASSLTILLERLKSSRVGEVLYSLDIMEDIEHNSLKTILVDLLKHPESQVRYEVLKRIERLDVITAQKNILQLLGVETSPQVRGTALRTLASLLRETDIFEELTPYLVDSEPDVRRGALVGLLRSGGIEGVLAAGEHLIALTSSAIPEERRFAAEVIADVGIRNFYRPLLKLIQDQDIEVQKAALLAAGRLKNPLLWPYLVKRLEIPALRRVAHLALVMAGESALGELKAVFKQENQPRNTQLRIIRICGQIGGQQAIQFLFNRKDFPDPQVRHQIFKAINRCRYRAKGRKAKQQVLATVRREVDDATWVLTCLEDVHQLSDQSLLIRSFNLELNQIRERLFLLFAMLYPPSVIMRLKAIYFSDQEENRAYALEVAENFVSKEVKDFVLFLFDDISNEQRFKRLSVTFPHSSLEYNDRLSTIIIGNHKQTSFWTRCCALYEVGLSRNSACYTAVVAALNSSDPIVCETAIWTLGKLNFNRDNLIVLLEPLTLSKQVNVAAMARFTLDTVALGTLSTRSPYLKRAGHHEIELIVAILLNAKEHRSRRCHAAKLLSCQHSQRAYSSLLQALLVKDRIVLMAVLNALRLGNFERTAQIREELLQILDEELAGVEQTQQALKTFRSESDFQQLAHALEQEIDFHRERVLQILSLLETPSLYERVAYWYQPGINQPLPARCRSQVRTACERLSSPTHRDKVLALLKLSQFDSLPPSINQEGSKEIIEQQLATLAFETSHWIRPWIRACALEKIGTLGLSQYTGHITKLLSNEDDIVRETAIWSLFELAPTLCRQHLTDLRQDASPLVAQTANKLAKKLGI